MTQKELLKIEEAKKLASERGFEAQYMGFENNYQLYCVRTYLKRIKVTLMPVSHFLIDLRLAPYVN